MEPPAAGVSGLGVRSAGPHATRRAEVATRALLAALVAGWLALVGPRAAFADPPIATPKRSVDLIVVGGDDKLAALHEALGPHELGSVRVRWSRANRVDAGDVLRAQPGEVAVRCFI